MNEELKLQAFIDALYAAGWNSPMDAQHQKIIAVYNEHLSAPATKPIVLPQRYEHANHSTGYEPDWRMHEDSESGEWLKYDDVLAALRAAKVPFTEVQAGRGGT